MDQFKPHVAQDLASWKAEYNVCDEEFDDPSTWGTGPEGKALRHSLALDDTDEAEHEEQVADSRPVHHNTLVARSKRAEKRSARKKRLKDDATNVHKYADVKRRSSRKISPSLIS
jgi:hypothetical protein